MSFFDFLPDENVLLPGVVDDDGEGGIDDEESTPADAEGASSQREES